MVEWLCCIVYWRSKIYCLVYKEENRRWKIFNKVSKLCWYLFIIGFKVFRLYIFFIGLLF